MQTKESQVNNMDVKIAFITTISQTMEWFILDTAKYLKSKGFKNISLICNMSDSFYEKYKNVFNLIPVGMKRGLKPLNVLKSIKQLTSIFQTEKFDLIYYLTPNAGLISSIAGARTKIPIRVYFQSGIRYVSETGLKKIILKTFEKYTCKKSTVIRAASPLNLEFAISEKLTTKDKIGIVGIGGTVGVNLDFCDTIFKAEERISLRNNMRIPADAFVFGYIGRLNKDKGCNELIDAFRRINMLFQNVYLIHLGMVDENSIRDDNYAFYKNCENIIKTGNVPQMDVYKYMTTMDLLVHPTYREGFGKVLQEAMGMSLPILTTNTIGPKEVVESDISGVLIEPKNSDLLFKAMVDLMNNPKKRETLSINGRKRAEKYFDQKIMLENLYQDFLFLTQNKKGKK